MTSTELEAVVQRVLDDRCRCGKVSASEVAAALQPTLDAERARAEEPSMTSTQHEDDSYGSCVVCREYILGSDEEYRLVPWPCPVAALTAERARAEAAVTALKRIDELPASHYRRNGFASPDPWVRQREVRRIARAALDAYPGPR